MSGHYRRRGVIREVKNIERKRKSRWRSNNAGGLRKMENMLMRVNISRNKIGLRDKRIYLVLFFSKRINLTRHKE